MTEPIDPTKELTAKDYLAAQASPEFAELRTKMRSFTFPLALLFLIWFMAYVLVAMFAPQIYAVPVFGLINVGILMGIAQFVTTFAITWAYVQFANKVIEPRARAIREELEHAALA